MKIKREKTYSHKAKIKNRKGGNVEYEFQTKVLKELKHCDFAETDCKNKDFKYVHHIIDLNTKEYKYTQLYCPTCKKYFSYYLDDIKYNLEDVMKDNMVEKALEKMTLQKEKNKEVDKYDWDKE